ITNAFSFNIPAGAVVSNCVYMRVRYTGYDPSLAGNCPAGNCGPGGIQSRGPALNGEVEDYKVEIMAPSALDYGDLLDSYNTLAANQGAAHIIDPAVFLGASVEADPDGNPGLFANGDDLFDGTDDEDGVTFNNAIVQGGVASISVVASVPGYLNAWIDYDRNGVFSSADDPPNKIIARQPLVAGVNELMINVPPNASVFTFIYSRFRFSSLPSGNPSGLSSFGLALDGEVEDYQISIIAAADTDGDCLPDWWEQLHFGDATSAVPGEDADGDGCNNLTEYIGDTDPNDADTCMRIDHVVWTGGDAFITFDSSSRRNYGLDVATDILNPVWTEVQSGVSGNDSLLQFVHPNADPRGFYRLKAELP
ncbi:MAG: GEVED domain-containing protein, partial [Verrucomicrobiota bacterium]